MHPYLHMILLFIFLKFSAPDCNVNQYNSNLDRFNPYGSKMLYFKIIYYKILVCILNLSLSLSSLWNYFLFLCSSNYPSWALTRENFNRWSDKVNTEQDARSESSSQNLERLASRLLREYRHIILLKYYFTQMFKINIWKFKIIFFFALTNFSKN